MESIIKYFVEEKGTTEVVAKILTETLVRYEDIKNEFCVWLEKRQFEEDNPIVIEGYSAKQIKELNPDFDVAGVYNFMVTLRENPKKGKEYIAKGFPKK